MTPRLPRPRGPLSAALIDHLRSGTPLAAPGIDVADPLTDDDLHLALWICYELHHHGFVDVPDETEWSPAIIEFRHHLEQAFEQALREEHDPARLPSDPAVALRVLSAQVGPPLSTTISEGTLDQLREFAVHRSAYQLKEADGHTWGLPRFRGRARSAMVQIQFDEYGGGVPGESHAELFSAAMRGLGLDDAFGAYIDRLPGSTLATDNLVELFGLNRRLRGALIGHLALFEMTSVTAMGRYLGTARRHGGLEPLERFYEVHVEADVRHAELALEEMVMGLVADQPQLADDVVFGASALERVEARFARHVLRCWDLGRSSLLDPARDASGVGSVVRLS